MSTSSGLHIRTCQYEANPTSLLRLPRWHFGDTRPRSIYIQDLQQSIDFAQGVLFVYIDRTITNGVFGCAP